MRTDKTKVSMRMLYYCSSGAVVLVMDKQLQLTGSEFDKCHRNYSFCTLYIVMIFQCVCRNFLISFAMVSKNKIFSLSLMKMVE